MYSGILYTAAALSNHDLVNTDVDHLGEKEEKSRKHRGVRRILWKIVEKCRRQCGVQKVQTLRQTEYSGGDPPHPT